MNKKIINVIFVVMLMVLASFCVVADWRNIDDVTGDYTDLAGGVHTVHIGGNDVAVLDNATFDISGTEQAISTNTAYGVMKLYDGQGLGNGMSRIMFLESSAGDGVMRFTVPSGGSDSGFMLLSNQSLGLWTGQFGLAMAEAPWSNIFTVEDGSMLLRYNGTIIFDVDSTGTINALIDLTNVTNKGNLDLDSTDDVINTGDQSIDGNLTIGGDLFFDTADEIEYDRSGNLWNFLVGGASAMSLSTTQASLFGLNLVLTDNSADFSNGASESFIKMKMYSQAGEPSLDADGKFAIWENSSDNSLYIIARNNGTTKKIQFT